MLHAFIISIDQYKRFSSLPVGVLDALSYTVYIIDYKWRYLYVNPTAQRRLGEVKIIGRATQEVWADYPDRNFEKFYNVVKNLVERRKPFSTQTVSPLNDISIQIEGYSLEDCYYFAVREVVTRKHLLSDLRHQMKRSDVNDA